MALGDARILLVPLMEIVLPGHTVRLCDGGFINWPAVGMFTAQDDLYGTVGGVGSISDSVADEAPANNVTMLPPTTAAAADLADPAAQGSVMRFWLAEADLTTATIVGTPELLFTGVLETVSLRLDRGERALEIEYASEAERLFSITEGNVQSPRWHKSIWPGETGLDHATGVSVNVAWGIAGPPRGSSYASGGGFTGAPFNFGTGIYGAVPSLSNSTQ